MSRAPLTPGENSVPLCARVSREDLFRLRTLAKYHRLSQSAYLRFLLATTYRATLPAMRADAERAAKDPHQ